MASVEQVRAPGRSVAQGRCANHPEAHAVLTCSRCGDFACTECAGSLHSQEARCKRCGVDAAARRNELGPHERHVRAIALYHWAITATFGMVAFGTGFVACSTTSPTQGGTALGEAFAALIATAFFGATAWQLQRFTSLGRVLAAISAVPGLLGVPIGPLISGYTLWALFGAKGKAVFTDEYRTVIALTPELEYGASKVVKIALSVFSLMIVAAMAYALLEH